jgi:hypothetical protein
MTNEDPQVENYKSPSNLEEARNFVSSITASGAKLKNWDKSVLLMVMKDLFKYPELDTFMFYLECLKHPDKIIRLEALSTIKQRLETRYYSESLPVLFKLVETETNSSIRGLAINTIGSLAGMHKILGPIPFLLSVLHNNKEVNSVRVEAYKALIYAANKEGDEKYYPFDMQPDIPVEEQIDWDWVKSLDASFSDLK